MWQMTWRWYHKHRSNSASKSERRWEVHGCTRRLFWRG
jgi:hypothetical protein